MKKALMLLLFTAGFAFAQTYPEMKIQDIDYIHPDSLVIADSLGMTGRGTLTNPGHYGDTVTVTGIVLVRPRIILAGARYVTYIQSLDSAQWGGMNVLTEDTSSNAANTGITSIDTGYVVQVTGWVTKYPTGISGTPEVFLVGKATTPPIPMNVIDVKTARPAPVEVGVGEFVSGDPSSGGKVKFSTGWKYKGSYVVLRNVTVKTRTQSASTKRWSWTVQDSAGNTIFVYDPSIYFRGGTDAFNPTWAPPAIGSKLAYMRGYITGYSTYGFAIVPIYPGDVEVAGFAPSITATGIASRRSAAFPTSNDSVTIRVQVVSTNPDTAHFKVDSVNVRYSVNSGSYVRVKMTPDTSANTFLVKLPRQSDNSFVKYYFDAWSNTLKSTYPDTTKTALFYYVRSNGYTIKDVQYTPFSDGMSGAVDLPVTLNGIVQADSTDYPVENDPRSGSPKSGTPRVFIQDAAQSWSGILLYGPLTYSLRRGDSVSVAGTVNEYSIGTGGPMTEFNVSSVNVIQSGCPTYDPVKVSTGTVGGKANGDPSAEQWESVLVEFDSVHITNVDPDNNITGTGGSFREYVVNDGTGGCRVDDDGSNTYSVDPHDTSLVGFTILPQGTFIKSLTGVLEYTYGNYKLEPRTNSDFVGVVTGVKKEPSPIPVVYSLDQNYPNPFNPSTTIRYSIPKASNVSLKIYNILGQEVATLVNQHQIAGVYSTTFDASKFASGVYFYRLSAGSLTGQAGHYSETKKLLLLK